MAEKALAARLSAFLIHILYSVLEPISGSVHIKWYTLYDLLSVCSTYPKKHAILSTCIGLCCEGKTAQTNAGCRLLHAQSLTPPVNWPVDILFDLEALASRAKYTDNLYCSHQTSCRCFFAVQQHSGSIPKYNIKTAFLGNPATLWGSAPTAS